MVAYIAVGAKESKQDIIDTVVDAIAADVGDFTGQNHLTTLLMALGIPDVSAKSLYTVLVTDYLAHATHGLAALEGYVDCLPATLNNLSAANVRGSVCLTGDNASTIGKILFDLNARATEARLAHLTQDIPNMVGTNNAALASVCTEARLAHLTQDIPSMVGTNNALLAASYTAPDNTGIGNIKTQTDKIANKMLFSMDFWSDLDDAIVLNATAADENLPNITIGDLPTGATIVRAIMMFKYSAKKDSSAAENKTVAAQIMSIDAAAGRDSVVTAINIPANTFLTDASAKEGGDVIIGDNDVAAEVTANATYYPTWELADVVGASLTFYDVQVGLRIWYSI